MNKSYQIIIGIMFVILSGLVYIYEDLLNIDKILVGLIFLSFIVYLGRSIFLRIINKTIKNRKQETMRRALIF